MDRSALTFARRDDHRVVGGVAGGFARRYGVNPWVVRGVLVVLTLTAGVGLALYAVGAVLSHPETDAGPECLHPPDRRRDLSVAAMGLGLVLVVRSTGVWLGDAVMAPLIIVVVGLVVLGVMRTDASSMSASQLTEVMTGRHARTRVMVGSSLIAVGLVMVAAGDRVSGSLRAGVYATAFTIVGVAVVVGPWVAGLVQSAADERRQRVRAQEREAVAAHLHDSVLQTLALIQRTADDPRRTVTLARQQEHELRAWLYGTDARSAGAFATAVRDLAREVEQMYDVQIEVVLVGDAALDDDLRDLCAAMREACVNAAKHSTVRQFSVYAEVTDHQVEAFVRDRGVGFDRVDAASDRRGVDHSIEARIERLGGTAIIESERGVGTEVRLVVPRSVVT